MSGNFSQPVGAPNKERKGYFESGGGPTWESNVDPQKGYIPTLNALSLNCVCYMQIEMMTQLFSSSKQALWIIL